MEEKDLEKMKEADCFFNPKQKGIIYSAVFDEETLRYVDKNGLIFVLETSNTQDPEYYW